MCLSVNIFLYGRFDLLILGENEAQIIDWKTERQPRSAQTLQNDWQTRLYWAMVVEGSAALGHRYTPEQVSMTYWFARAPEKSVTLRYSAQQHAKTWAELQATVEQLDSRLESPLAIWPLTENWKTCENCGYRPLCNRTIANSVEEPMLPTEEENGAEILLDPPI